MAASSYIQSRQRLTIRISRNSLSFSSVNPEGQVVYEPYTVRSGISMAANLRKAVKEAEMPRQFSRAQVMIDTPVLMIPIELFDESSIKDLYSHSYPGHSSDEVLFNVLPDLKTVAAFSINKDLKLVVGDNYEDVTFFHTLTPVWRHFNKRSYTGVRNKLYGYFHDKKLEIMAFRQNRFKYCNTFDTERGNDALYFMLYVWKLLQMRPDYDELHIVGDIPDREWLTNEVKRFIERAYVINPSGEFNRSHVTQIKGMPYDLMTFYIKGK